MPLIRTGWIAVLLFVSGCPNTAGIATSPRSPPPETRPPEPLDAKQWLSTVLTGLSAQAEDASELVDRTEEVPQLGASQFWIDRLSRVAGAMCDGKAKLADPSVAIPEGDQATLDAARVVASELCDLQPAYAQVAAGSRQGLPELKRQTESAGHQIDATLDAITSLRAGDPAASP